MNYYLSDYTEIPWHYGETRRVPTVTLGSDGEFSSLPLGKDHAIVAVPHRLKGVHLCDNAKEQTGVPAKILGDYFRCSCTGRTLGVTAAELLLHHAGPGRWPPLMPSRHRKNDGGRYEIYLANERIWQMPCVAGGMAVFTDNFNRVDEVPLATGTAAPDRWNPIAGLPLPWLKLEAPPDLGSGRVINEFEASPFPNRHRGARWNPANFPFQNDQVAQIQAAPLVSTVGVLARVQDDPTTPGQGTQNGYFFYWFTYNPDQIAQQFFLDRMDGSLTGGTPLLNSRWSSIGFESLGCTLRLEASGSTLRCYASIQITQAGGSFLIYLSDPRPGGVPSDQHFGLALIYETTDTIYSGGTPGFDLSFRPNFPPRHQTADNFSFEGDSGGSPNTTPTIC